MAGALVADLVLQVADAETTWKPARINTDPQPLGPNCLVEVSNQVVERQRVWRPPHPLVGPDVSTLTFSHAQHRNSSSFTY